MTNGEAWRSHLMSDYWFANLPAGLQDSLLSSARLRRKTPGKLLFERGDAPCGLYVLLEGILRVDSADRQRLAPRLEEVRLPYWFGEVSLFDGLPRTQNMFSMSQTIFLHVPYSALAELLRENPSYWRFFAQLLSQKLALPLLGTEQFNLLPAKARVAWRLLMLCEGYGNLSHARRLISFHDMQSLRTLNLSSAGLREVLAELQQRKILRLDEDQVEIFDVVKLRKAANHIRAKAPC